MAMTVNKEVSADSHVNYASWICSFSFFIILLKVISQNVVFYRHSHGRKCDFQLFSRMNCNAAKAKDDAQFTDALTFREKSYIWLKCAAVLL